MASDVMSLSTKSHDIALTNFTNADDIHLKALAHIGSQPEVYKYLGRGHPWSLNYILNIKRQAIQDAINSNFEYLHWFITYANVVVGYIGIRPCIHFPGSQLRIFMDPKTIQGLEHDSLRKAFDMMRDTHKGTKIWSLITKTNQSHMNIMTGLGFQYQRKIFYKGIWLLAFNYEL